MSVRNFGMALLLILFANCSQTKVSGTEEKTEWTCAGGGNDSVAYLHQLGCPTDWAIVEGKPMSMAHGQASSVKFIFVLETGIVYFTNSNLYELHKDFAVAELNLGLDVIANWDHTQYRENADRLFVLGTVNHYQEPDVYTVQFFPGEDLGAERLRTLFQILQTSTWFGDSLLFLPLSEDALQRATSVNVPTISVDSLHAGQAFQSMNPGEAYGTLVRCPATTIESATFARHDIVLTNGLPNNLPVVGGVITTQFQTPLSHINVLSKNRHTPNMALRSAWNDSNFLSLEGRLVHLIVTPDSFMIESANIEDANAFWDSTGPGLPPELPMDSSPELLSTDELSLSMLPRVGAKAANFGELAKLAKQSNGSWKVPEAGFAIPFIHYWNHMNRNGLTHLADSLMQNTEFQVDAQKRKASLEWLQERISSAPLDSNLLGIVERQIQNNGISRMRFRSSTNAEDIEGFNGAGLYSSYTGILGSSTSPIADAIRKVWASLWNFRAYEERSFFRIEQNKVAMGILVHRSFPNEAANGVAFTYNIYKPEYFGYVINVQHGDVSVVTPPEGVQCEQLVYYPFSKDYVGEISIDPISRSSLTKGTPVLSEPEIRLLGTALRQVENRYQFQRMDVEFKFDGVGRALYLKQARPAP